MTPQVYLIAPADTDAVVLHESLPARLSPQVAVILFPRGQRADDDYGRLITSLAPALQSRGIAVLVEGEPALVRALGADGLHVTGDAASVRDAIARLKPDLIVGAGNIRSRHDAMQKAEMGIDYILFGPLSGAISDADRDLAHWWAETMEVPSVLSDPLAASAASVDAGNCEFVGVSLTALGATL